MFCFCFADLLWAFIKLLLICCVLCHAFRSEYYDTCVFMMLDLCLGFVCVWVLIFVAQVLYSRLYWFFTFLKPDCLKWQHRLYTYVYICISQCCHISGCVFNIGRRFSVVSLASCTRFASLAGLRSLQLAGLAWLPCMTYLAGLACCSWFGVGEKIVHVYAYAYLYNTCIRI